MFEFDRFCKEKAMKKFKEYGLERDFFLFLNIHSETIDSGLAGSDWIKRRADYYGLIPEKIVVEVCETKVQNSERLIESVKRYREYGFLIALDDFGVKHSNIERLLLLEIFYVKIAKVLIEMLDQNPKKQRLLEGIYNILRILNLTGILEGVETLGESYILQSLGFGYAQGFLFSHPLSNPMEALFQAEKYLKEIKSTFQKEKFYKKIS